ncbi:MAG: DUF3530 family protein [Methylococcaceae bacterium]|nr:DUF3530 family protein [Methylococcaceae bacterium]
MLRFLCVFLTLWTLPVPAQDLGREIQMGQEMELREGRETLWLEAAGVRFAALHRLAIGGRKRGGMLLVPDSGSAPDAGLLQAIRLVLPERGWNTLAIVTPIAEPDASEQRILDLMPLGVGRIDAGLKQLRNDPSTAVALVGQGIGALMVARFVAERPDAGVKALVLIDAPSAPSLDAALLEALGKIKSPVLDVLANRSSAAEPEAALQRKRAQQANSGYRQVVVADARGDYGELRETLGNLIHGWMSRILDATLEPRPTAAPGSAPSPVPAADR